MFFDTYRLATLRIAEDLRQAEAERRFRAVEPEPVTVLTPDLTTVAAAPAVTLAVATDATTTVPTTADCGDCRSTAAA